MTGLILTSDRCEEMDRYIHILDLKEERDFNTLKG